MLLLGALLGGRLLRGRPAGTGEARSRRIFDAAPHFLAAGFLAAGFLAAGFRLAAAMADVSPVPSEGAGALAVDSRAAAPHAPGPVPRASLPPHRACRGPTGAQTQRSSNWPDDPAARRGRCAKKRQRRRQGIVRVTAGCVAS